MCDWYAGTAQLRRKYSLSSSRKLSARALSPWNVAGGDPCGRTSGGTGCPAPPAAGGAPPGGPPPPGDPGVPPPGGPDPPPPDGPDPPPGGPHPEGPPDGGFGGSYFFMAFPKAFATRCSCVGAVVVNPTVSVGAIVVLISGSLRSSPFQGGSIAFGTSGLSLMLKLIAFWSDSSMSSSVSGRLFPFPLLVSLCSS